MISRTDYYRFGVIIGLLFVVVVSAISVLKEMGDFKVGNEETRRQRNRIEQGCVFGLEG